MDRAESDHRVGIHQVTRADQNFHLHQVPAQSKTCHPDSQNAEYLDSNLLWPDCQFSKYHELSFAFHYDDDDDVNLKYEGRHLEADTMWKFTKSNAFAGYQ